jgi:predicted acyltransferase
MILVNSRPGVGEDAYPALRHALWNGWTFADTIFPAFLWIVGVAMTLSTGSRIERGGDRVSLLKHAIRRSVLLFCCGVSLDLFYLPVRHFPFIGFTDRLQLTGVLQKIAVCYLVAFAIYLWTQWRGAVVGIVLLNAVYLALMLFFPVPGCGAGVLTTECNFAGYLDRNVLGGHLWGVPNLQDPDGLGGILPAISTVLFGVLIGLLLRSKKPPGVVLRRLVGIGLGLMISGAALSAWVIPVNKPIWSTSYALLMAGISTAAFAVCYWVADMQRRGRWLKPLEIFGMNALAAYVISRVGANLPKVHYFGMSLYDVCLRLASGVNASLLYAVVYTTGVYIVIWWMYRRQWFLRL